MDRHFIDFMKNKNEFVNFYPALRDFGLRAKQELSRAERYACFLSMITVNMDSLLGTLKKRVKFKNGDYEAVLKKIREFVQANLRETDIISGIEDNKMLILLSETPFNGASHFSQRLAKHLKEYIASTYDFSFKSDIPLEISSFPHSESSALKLSETVEELLGD